MPDSASVVLIMALINDSLASLPAIVLAVAAPADLPSTLATVLLTPKSFNSFEAYPPARLPAPDVTPPIKIWFKSPPDNAVLEAPPTILPAALASKFCVAIWPPISLAISAAV